jgi:hypothetical protein
MPAGRPPIGDIMLAQKLALELFETDAIDAANKFASNYDRASGTPRTSDALYLFPAVDRLARGSAVRRSL